MECGKLTAKLRDAVPVCFMVNDHEVKRYKNIEIPEEIKHLEYCGFRFDVPETGAITFKIWFDEGILPETWPATRERQHRAPKASRSENMELQFGVRGADRKTSEAANSVGIPLPLLYEVYEDSGGSELRRINDKGLAPERTGTSGKFLNPDENLAENSGK